MAGSFYLDLKNFARKGGEDVDRAVYTVVLELYSRVVIRSPVRSGRFRGNWHISVGDWEVSTTLDVDPTGDLSRARAAAAIPKEAAGKVIYIQNNLPYAWRLENGWSKQAPNGMVALTVVEFSGITSKAAAEVRAGVTS